MTSSYMKKSINRQKHSSGLSNTVAYRVVQRTVLAVTISTLLIAVTLMMAGGVSAATTVADLNQLLANPAANSPANAPLLFANAITGTVFRDYDSDGTRDELRAAIPNVAPAVVEPGVGGIIVSAYNTDNNLITSTTTAADGTYSLDIAANNSVRIEFTGIPDYLQPGVAGPDSSTSVTFVDVGSSGTTQVNLGVINPSQYCNVNPNIAIPCFTYGDQTGNLDVVISFGYASGADTPNESPATGLDNIVNKQVLAEENQAGSTYGVAYHRHTEKLFAAAFIKRFSGLGPDGPGAIYQLDPTGTNAPTLFMDLAAAPYNLTVGTDPHPIDRNDNTPCGGPPGSVGPQGCYFHDPATFAEVGKISLADMDTTEDDQTLYVVNLASHELVEIPIGIDGVAPPAVTTYALPVHPDCTAGTADDVRAGGLGILDGLVYTGIVCSANNSQDVSKLIGYIYQFNPDTLNFTQVLSIPFDYPRGCINHEGSAATCDPLMDKDWLPWDDTPDHGEPISGGDGFGRVYPQPWIMGIEFDQGNMIIGVRDRNGDQLGFAGQVNDFNSDLLIEGDAGGDILRACGNPDIGWTLENDGSCGGITTAGSTANEGIGGGEYYHGDSHWNHRETTFGGIAIIPSQPDLISAVFDPWDDIGPPPPIEQFYDQGILWFNNQTGDKDRALRIVDGNASNLAGIDGFGKSNGLGDIVAICDAAPLEVGNRVWFDDDGDGIQAPDEAPIAGVEVVLYLAGTPIATATTDAAGQYYFIGSNHPNAGTVGSNYGIAPTLAISTNYEIRLDLTQPAVSALNLTTPDADGDSSNDNKADLHDSDGIQMGDAAIIAFATGLAGHNNHTLDFGFFGTGVNTSIEKYDDPKVVTPGQTLGYTVRFAIVGTDPVATITVTDELPIGVDGITFQHVSAAIIVSSTLTLEGAAAFNPPTVAGDGVTWVGNYNPPLPSGTVGYITYTVVVSDNVSTIIPLDNLVQITIPQSETTLVDNVFTETTPLAAIDLEKATNGFDADGDSGPYIAAGDPVTWTYRVMNTGSVPLTEVFVEDVDFLDNTVVITPTAPITLAVGETVTFTFQGIASITGQYTNTATVTGTATVSGPDAFGNTITTTFPLTDTDPSHYFAYVPDIALEKYTNGVDADTLAEAPLIPTGDEVVWTYLITNTGNITLTSLTLNDDKLGDLGCLNGPLPDPFLAGATFTCIATGTAVTGPYTNTAVITGLGTIPGPGGTSNITLTDPVTDTDPSHYISADVNIDLEKYTNGFNADDAPGPFITANNPVTWTYGITNVGSITLTNITLNDDQEGLISSCPQTTLAPGEAMTCIQTGTAILGGYENNAIVTATPTITWPTVITDADPSHYFNQTLQLGNQVWFDLNNDGQINGSEAGLSEVIVNLLDENGNVIDTLLTTASGFYTFTNLSPATYTVEIDAANFSPTGVLSTYVSSSVDELNGPNGDRDDNGVNAVNGGIQSNPIALTLGNQPTGEPEEDGSIPDEDSNLTVDFGFFQPMRLGNQIWADVNNNGLIDSGENGLPNVAVNLLNSGGGVLTSTLTDASGFYTFTNLLPGTYIVEVAPANFISTGVLSTYTSSSPNEVNGTDGDRDDNGVNAVNGGIQSNPIVLEVGQEPTGEAEEDGTVADGSSNLTVDFGFFEALRLGNRVWADPNNNGQLDPTESGIANVTLCLQDGLGNAITDVNTSLPITTTTDANGFYLFTGLEPGDYIVCIEPANFGPGGPLQTFMSSGPTENDPNNAAGGTDSDDNGINDPNYVTNGISSGVINLVAGLEPITEIDEDGSFTDENSNLTVDFSFFELLSLGNQIWNDIDNDGQLDPDEMGVANVVIELLDGNGNPVLDPLTNQPITTTTDSSGNYLFTGLISGTYIISVPAENFQPNGPLADYLSSGVTETDPNADVDNNDNGIDDPNPTVNGIQTGPVQLSPGDEPTNDGDTSDNSNLSVDLGFYQPLGLGNQVWLDVNNNGLLDPGEAAISDVIVNLLDESGNTITTTTTNSSGIYTFTNLISGTYIVEIDPINFTPTGVLSTYISSTVDEPNGPNGDNDDNGVNLTNGGVQSDLIMLTPGQQPTGENGEDGSILDENNNLTIDFGFFEPLQIGNQVWLDADDDGEINNGEIGLAGVIVNLLDENGATLDTTVTNANGIYTFTNLISGTYVVEIAAANFAPGGALVNHTSSSVDEAAGVDGDNDDNGVNEVNGGIQSNPITLSYGDEPTGEAGDDGSVVDSNSNLTVDFGFNTPGTLAEPLQLGNQIWLDIDNDGLFDPGEAGLGAVVVNLLDGNGNPVIDPNTNTPISTITDPNGVYTFTNLISGTYIVEIDPVNFTATGVLSNYVSSSNDAVNGVDGDNDDNGVNEVNGGIQSNPILLTPGQEPTGESGENGPIADNNSNLTIDFGFTQLVRLGNLVWEDDNRNGLFDGSEVGIPGVTVCLQDGNGNPALDANGQPICTVTDANGEYLFSDLFPGDYIVSIEAANFVPNGPLFMMASSQPTEADPNADVDNNDNGIDNFAPTTHGIQSGLVTLQVQTEPVGEAGEDACTCPDDNSNLTVDFGFVQALNIGNLIWFDYGNASSPGLANNSDADQGEPGAAGIVLELIKDGNVIATTTTDANGNYFFNVIDPGTYQVCVVAANFQPGGVLEGHISSSLFTDPDDNVNNDDNGIDEGEPAITGVCSEPITIGYGEEPLDDGTDNTTGNTIPTTTNTNFTIDFGFYGPPTAITLLSFTANTADGGVRLTWQTAIEVDNFGFRLLRSNTGDLADAVEIAFISGQGQGTGSGAEYVYIDTTASSGQNYTYWLVDVDVSGLETIHDNRPVSVSISATGTGTLKTYLPIIAK